MLQNLSCVLGIVNICQIFHSYFAKCLVQMFAKYLSHNSQVFYKHLPDVEDIPLLNILITWKMFAKTCSQILVRYLWSNLLKHLTNVYHILICVGHKKITYPYILISCKSTTPSHYVLYLVIHMSKWILGVGEQTYDRGPSDQQGALTTVILSDIIFTSFWWQKYTFFWSDSDSKSCGGDYERQTFSPS